MHHGRLARRHGKARNNAGLCRKGGPLLNLLVPWQAWCGRAANGPLPQRYLNTTDMMGTSNVDTDAFGARSRLKELRVAHRDLDVAIDELTRNPTVDQIRVRRLKKQKLRLKDLIARLESEMIPDLDA
jgi:hypothetical protein